MFDGASGRAGKALLRAIQASLLAGGGPLPGGGLMEATDVVVSGSSAGGLAALDEGGKPACSCRPVCLVLLLAVWSTRNEMKYTGGMKVTAPPMARVAPIIHYAIDIFMTYGVLCPLRRRVRGLSAEAANLWPPQKGEHEDPPQEQEKLPGPGAPLVQRLRREPCRRSQ